MTDTSLRTARRLVAVLSVLLMTSAVAACSDDDDAVGTDATTTTVADDGGTAATEPPGAASTTVASAAGTEVAVKDFAFEPSEVTVATGDAVTWTFEDDVPHNVAGEGFKSDNLSDGQTYSHTFDGAGTFAYVCTLHPGMKGTVTVS